MQDFRKLKVWQKSHQAALEIYKATRGFPRDELFGLTAQIRRSSISVGANIAEGCGRGGDRDFARFLQVAMGSASELEYLLLLAHDLTLLSKASYDPLASDVTEAKRMLAGLIQRLTGRKLRTDS